MTLLNEFLLSRVILLRAALSRELEYDYFRWRWYPRAVTSEFIDPRDYAPRKLMQRAAELSIPERSVRRWLGQVIGQGEYDRGVWSRRGVLSKQHLDMPDLPRLRLEKTFSSHSSAFQKLLFRTADELPVECVLIPLHKTGAVSVCLSSQVGCVMGCRFCATGRMQNRRDLRTWEIMDQFIQARAVVRESHRRVTGAVFMGMGEPFLNYDRVLAAAELLCFPILDAISAQAITISTVGLVPQIERFTDEARPFRLSISLGAATDDKRRELVPTASQTPLARVMEAASRHSKARGVRVVLSYVCISKVNVSEDDARALGELIKDTPVRLDLIDVADPTGRYCPPDEKELRTFRDALRVHLGQPIARRYSGGADINAACGTLGAT